MLTFANMKLKMRLRYIIILSLPLLILATSGSAQKWKLKRYEAIVGIGTAHYFGDIGGAQTEDNLFGIKDIEIKGTRPSIYLGARYKITPNIAVKANFIYGFLAGSDEGSLNNDRNYAFSTGIFEPSVQAEYSIISEEQKYRSSAMYNRRGMMNNYSKFNVYGFAGIGGLFLSVKPNEEMEGSVNYDPSHPTIGLAFPMGIGAKFVLSGSWSVGGELGGRFTTSDYLDGYTTQWSKHNDVYYFFTIQAIYRIKTSRRGFPILFGARRGSFL
jgi:hypothetical protein